MLVFFQARPDSRRAPRDPLQEMEQKRVLPSRRPRAPRRGGGVFIFRQVFSETEGFKRGSSHITPDHESWDNSHPSRG